MRKLLFTFLLTWLAFAAHAQNRVIKGKVTEPNGDAMPGVTVTVKETQQRTVTNTDGNYTITIADPQKHVLEFKFIGYKTREVDITGQTTVDVKMAMQSSDLSEVVVTALGISREKKSVGVAQQSVNVDEMTEARAANITDLLDGKVAGLQLTTSGQATGSTRVVIRGAGSVTGDNQPLWVVDGVPVDNSDGQTTNGGGNSNNLDYGNGASALNPDDIQSIEVLKGPNAAALYGSRAANGAILVTTKKGKKNAGVGVSVNENLMLGQILQFPYFQNIYGEGGNQILSGTRTGQNPVAEGTNGASYGGPMLGQPVLSYSGAVVPYSPHPDNVTSLYHTSYALTQNFSISNATETPAANGSPALSSSIRLSYSRTDANDVIDKQGIQTKNNLAFSASKDFTRYLRIDTRAQYLHATVQNRVARNEDPANPNNLYNNLARNVAIGDLNPYKDAAGNELFSGTTGLENPYWLINENYNEDNTNTIIGGVTATLKLLPGLQFRGQISGNLIWGGRQYFLQKGAISTAGKLGAYSEFSQNNQNWNSEGLFIYNKQLRNFSISANFGGNIRTQNNYNQTSAITSLLAHDVMNLANNASVPTTQENLIRSQTNSLYGSASIGYKGFLYLDVTGRNDWSSTLPAANRSFFYPSASTSFVFTEVLKIPETILSFGKLRASVADVGNDTSPYNLYSLFNYKGAFNGSPYISFDNVLKNSNLKPEKTLSYEVGLELKFLKDRIAFDGSLYTKNTTNQILTGAVTPTSGFYNEVINAGSVTNKGIELSLTGTAIRSKNFTWDVLMNFSANRNRVNSLIDGLNTFRIGGVLLTDVNAEVGQPIGVIRGEDELRDAEGNVIIQASGVPYSGSTPYTVDGKIRSVLGNFQPKSLESFGSTFRYKNFDFNFLLSGRIGGQIFSGTYYRADVKGTTLQTLPYRDQYEYSAIVLGEGGTITSAGKTTVYGNPYPDASRNKGPVFQGYFPLVDSKGNIVYDANGLPIADKTKPNTLTQNPNIYYVRYNHISSYLTFDDSFIKLSQVIIGYNVPKSLLSRTIVKSARVSLVGRNLWTILQNTPRGIDPESAYSSGNAQGLELGGSLPYFNYGFDLKLSF